MKFALIKTVNTGVDKMSFLNKLGKEILFFDGGMGTLLQAAGMPAGAIPELYNIDNPALIEGIHHNYLKSGANIIKTNTFGANPLKLTKAPYSSDELIKAGISVARRACRDFENSYVALDIGPLGKLLKPVGDLSFEAAVDSFASMVKSGRDADLILIETMSDIYETKAAVLAAKENCNLPVVVTMFFDEHGRLLTGGDIKTAVGVVEGLGADAIGLNCGLGPKQMLKLIPEFLKYSSIPVVVNPNAGLPVSENGKTVFKVEPYEFAEDMKKMAELGIAVAGGCCGTTPAHIKKTVELLKGFPVKPTEFKRHTFVTSYSHAVDISMDFPVIIGERINPTGKKRLKEALKTKDMTYILNEALSQEEKGAHILDVNVGMNEIDQKEMMKKIIFEIQSVSDIPLQIDAEDPEVLEAALRMYNGKAMVNSVNGKEESMKAVFPLIKKYGGVVVALCLDENGIPDTAEGRFNIALKVAEKAKEYGIDIKNIVFDPLAMTISTGKDNANITLETIRLIKENLNANTVLGVSNISFGLPQRDNINSTFFALALNTGLSAGIINPLSEAMKKAYHSYLALSGKDDNCALYIEKYGTDPQSAPSVPSKEITLKDAIIKGLREQAFSLCTDALKESKPLELIDGIMIPALNTVGEEFEAKRMFLPQLLMAADAAKSAFDAIKNHLSEKGIKEEKKGKILLATVKGDIHDIGKNIVKVLLENYGYDVLDLGKDINFDEIVEKTVSEKIELVGLSALMTTTVDNMEETIKRLRTATNCKIMVGGAVLTEEYAKKIGADHYSKDAMESVRYANQIFN